jgi:hypothetical protein
MAKGAMQAASGGDSGEGGWRGWLLSAACRFESVVNAAAARIPSSRLRMWLSFFFHPEEEYAKAAGRATPAELAFNLIFFYFFYSLLFFLFMLGLTSILPPEELLPIGLNPNPDLAQIALGSLVVGPIASAVTVLAAFALICLPARALGGTGSYVRQAYAMSLLLCASNVLLLSFALAAFAVLVPSYLAQGSLALGALLAVLGMLVNVPVFLACAAIVLYTIYAYYLVVMKAHGLSSWRAAGSIAAAAALAILADAAVGWLLKTM